MRLITGYLGKMFILPTCHNCLQKFRVHLVTKCILSVNKYDVCLIMHLECIHSHDNTV